MTLSMVLQWSRNLRVAESDTDPDEVVEKITLQWSRNLRVAESTDSCSLRTRIMRFNGAAT